MKNILIVKSKKVNRLKPVITIVLALFVYFLNAGSADAQEREISGRVVSADNNAGLPGANIVIKGTTRGTATAPDGSFTLKIPDAGATLVVSYIGYSTQEVQVTNEPEITIALPANVEEMMTVVVVGTRNVNRTALDTPVPVDVLDIKELQKIAPQIDVNQLLTYVAPSFQSNRQSASDGSEHIDPASLRGLGPDQVLILINGKRRHNTSLVNNQQTFGNGSVGTDLNAIPTFAIARIEVLRDGAAAQYGSDAIAGVINIVLKSSVDKITSSVTGGATSEGDGETVQYNANYGFRVGSTGFFNVTGEYLKRQKTNRTQNHELVIFDQSQFGNFFAYPFSNPNARAIDDSILTARGLKRDDFNFRVGNAQIENAGVFFNTVVPLSSGVEIYGFGGLSYRDGRGSGFRRLPSDGDNNVESIFRNGFQPETQSTLLDRSLAAGVRGEIKDWHVDLSNTFGTNRFDYTINNTVNASLGAASQTSFDGGGHEFTQNTTNLDFSRYFQDPLDGALRSVNLAFGSEFRVDRYQIHAGEEASYRDFGVVDQIVNGQIVRVDTNSANAGAQSFPGFRPENEVDEYRSNVSVYADVEVDFTEKVLLAGALRFEDYSDFGNRLNAKIATRIRAHDRFSLRGSVSTGFRAPSLHQSFFNTITIDLVDGRLVDTGIFRNDSRLAEFIGIPKLKEETSVSLSAGFTTTPFDNFSLSVDGYVINVDDRIVLTGTFGNDPFGGPIPELVALFQQVGATSGRFFTNAVDTKTKGLDIVATYNTSAGASDFRFSLAANFTDNEVDDKLNIPAALVGQEDIYFGPQEKSLIETNIPDFKLNFTINYRYQKFSALVRNVYFGEVTRNGFPFGVEQKHDGKLITDLSLSYQLTPQVSVTVGGNNIFDVFPDEQVFDNSFFGVFKYAPVQQGMDGSYFFGRIGVSL
ncbi:TonB-dependent receptor [candidate division KSB1 bacterium]|nr:TonB-dependent receptor [candidate division KSB1 bacterium]